MSIHFSSANERWNTPPQVFQSITERYGPCQVDAAADAGNALCPHFINAEMNGLESDWNQTDEPTAQVWLNPPYGRGLRRWARKALQEIQTGRVSRIILLVPARTETIWFKELVQSNFCSYVDFLGSRIRFGGHETNDPAPFPSAVIVLDHEPTARTVCFDVDFNQ